MKLAPLAVAVLLALAPGATLAQAKEARAAREAERKRVDQQRRVERKCAEVRDDKARAECEKKESAKTKG